MSRYRAARPCLALSLFAAATIAFGCGVAEESAPRDDDAGNAPAVDAGVDASPTNPGADEAGRKEYWPDGAGDSWETVSPEAAGWNGQKLDEALAFAETRASTAFVILVGGRILAERYWQGWDRHSHGQIFSATKSFASVLTGIAQQRGMLAVSDTVTKHLGAGWSKAPAASEATITLEHLLTMSSGLDDDLVPVGEPGQKWYYSTGAYVKLLQVLDKVTGDLRAFSQEALFSKIGLKDSAWAPGGQTIDASALDMARFGLMMLRGGRWASGDVLADKTYVVAATTTSQPLNLSYGRLFWLNGKASFVAPTDTPPVTGSLVPAAPADMVMALGKGDKKIYAVPSRHWVVVRHGASAGPRASLASSTFDNELWEKLMAAAPAAEKP